LIALSSGFSSEVRDVRFNSRRRLLLNMLDPEKVPISQSALLVIDAQDSFKANQRWDRRDNLAFEKNVGILIEAYRSAHLPIVFFLHTDHDEGFERDSRFFKLMDFIKPRPDEPLMIKNTRNCFTSTALQPHLIERGVRRVEISGIQMEQCCETTARIAADLGYAVDFITEATMTFPIPNWDKPGEELGVDAIRERTEYALRRRFARIITVDRLTKELKSIQR
jgi:nicotinamidase-related amidase